MTIYGYASDAQRAALVESGATEIVIESVQGMKNNRPELANLLGVLKPGDTLIVADLAQAAGSTRDLLALLDSVARTGAVFQALNSAWANSAGEQGQMLRTVLAGLASFERDLLLIRTGEGRLKARARGQHMGRPPTLTGKQQAQIREALTAGHATQADMARQFQVSQSTISRAAGRLVPAIAQPALDADTERAARTFLHRIAGRYPVDRAILFGSRARRTHNAESDADMAIVLKGKPGKRAAAAIDMAGIAFEVMLETGILVEALPLWCDEVEHPERFSNPALIHAIRREGIAL